MDNSANPTSSCNTDGVIPGLDIASLALQLLTCFFGAIGSSLSLWCLVTCQRIKLGMKIQLGLFFTILLILCVVALPGATVVEFGSLRCWEEKVSVRLAFVAIYTIAVGLERNIFAAMAVFRLIAVSCPQKYKVLSRPRVVVGVEVFICIAVILMWMPTFLVQDGTDVDVNNPSSYSLGRALYFVVFLFPIFVTVVAYFLLFVVMFVRKQQVEHHTGKRSSRNEQINLAVGVLILTNLLLDVPHISVHLLGAASKDVSFIVVHIIYRLHLALDSFIFLGLNQHYRRKIWRLIVSCIPGCASLYPISASTTADIESSSRRPDSIGIKSNPMFSTSM